MKKLFVLTICFTVLWSFAFCAIDLEGDWVLMVKKTTDIKYEYYPVRIVFDSYNDTYEFHVFYKIAWFIEGPAPDNGNLTITPWWPRPGWIKFAVSIINKYRVRFYYKLISGELDVDGWLLDNESVLIEGKLYPAKSHEVIGR
jgi:hypothetical protein